MLKNFLGKITKKCHKEHLRHADLEAKSPSSSRKSNLLKFEANNIRLLVIRDTEQGIKKLFDSQIQYDGTRCTVPKVPLNYRHSDDSGLASSRSSSFSGCSTLSGSFASGRIRSNSDRIGNVSSDVSALAEMMFGNVSMKIVGDSVKVHYIRSTNEFLLTKVFVHKPNSSTASCSLTDQSEASPCPSPSLSSSADNSIPRNYSSSSFTGDANRVSSSLMIPRARPSSQLSNESSTSCMGSGGGSKSNSYQRRLEHSWYTSFENEYRLYYHVKKPLLECSTKSNGCSPSNRKHRKIAIGLIFSLDEKQFSQFEQFFFSHFALIYSHLEELRLVVDDNLHMLNFKKADWTEFHTGTRKAFDEFSEDFLALYNTPRVEDPVWLTLVARPDLRKTLCAMFMEKFVYAINKMDTKENKFFMSTLLTAVLTHHCAWIYTVSNDAPDRQEENKHKPKALDLLSKTHPYNSLWAQLGDLYGAITHPMTVTRTIVTGRTSSLIETLLFLLTYFIRCFDIEDICEMEPNDEFCSRCNSVASGHITPKSDQHFSDFPCNPKSNRETQSVASTPSKKKPNPFSFPSMKSPIPRSRNISQSDKDSFEQSLKSVCSSSAGSLKASPSHASKTKDHVSRSWRHKASLHDSNRFSSEGDLTSCSTKAVACGLSDDTATAASCDNSDSLSLHTNVPGSPLFRKWQQSGQRDCSSVCAAEESPAIPGLSRDGISSSGVRFNSKCQDYLQSCEVCSRASTPELQCSEECLLNQTCRLLFQTSSQCFIPRDACHKCDEQYTCPYSSPSSCTDKPKSSERTSKSSNSSKKEPRCSMAVCENPFYVVFDPNCSYTSQRHKHKPVDKPQVCTRLPLIWPQNSWEEVLPEDDAFDSDGRTSSTTTQDNDKEKDVTDSVWPQNSCGFFNSSSTTNKQEPSSDLIFPHNSSTEYRMKQETCYSYGVSNTSPISKDSGNCSYAASSRLDNESFATNEESSGICGEGAFDFSVEESLPPAMIHHHPAEDGTCNKRASLLAEQLQEYEMAKEGGYLGLEHYTNFEEVDLSTCYDLETCDKSNPDVSCKQFSGFGKSLMASTSDKYLSDFVLHGTTQKDFSENLYEDLKAVIKCSVVDDPVDYAQAVVADTHDWSVKIYSVSRPQDVWVPNYNEQSRPATISSSVRSMLEAIQVLWKMNMPAEFCMLHLEDRLQALNETGMLLGSCLAEHAEGSLPNNLPQLTKLFRVDISDLQLLLAVASAHSPEVGKMLHSAQLTNRR